MEQLAWHHATRVCIVGDDMQALYGWKGADPNALESLFRRFNSQRRPLRRFQLPICRRCPRSHIDRANGVKNQTDSKNEDMRPMADAPEGTFAEDATFVTHPLQTTALSTTTHAAPQPPPARGGRPARDDGKVILARRNAPLIACLYACASRGIAVEMLGKRPLAKKLDGVLKDIKPSDLGALEVRAC